MRFAASHPQKHLVSSSGAQFSTCSLNIPYRGVNLVPIPLLFCWPALGKSRWCPSLREVMLFLLSVIGSAHDSGLLDRQALATFCQLQPLPASLEVLQWPVIWHQCFHLRLLSGLSWSHSLVSVESSRKILMADRAKQSLCFPKLPS